ncbi:hypothetical protein N7532_012125 [Penicillium argentinense]|uniref:Uncharacterized protein n=1 Tax=Penicillium argentinense TaxID=1131581 RepID=A0A9W9EJR0_9EURO|nr:uncharacterized protein N7532_012125 [Penicillium argentinense]KAJ5083082.1 hypothetical protein N7532_012125 [Penicillium argentinense]
MKLQLPSPMQSWKSARFNLSSIFGMPARSSIDVGWPREMAMSCAKHAQSVHCACEARALCEWTPESPIVHGRAFVEEAPRHPGRLYRGGSENINVPKQQVLRGGC